MAKKKISRVAARLRRVEDRPHAALAAAALPSAARDGRALRRLKAYKIGLIRFNRLHEVSCVLDDFTTDGARVRLSAHETLPPIVILEIRLAGLRRRARVVWQKENEAGLEFES